MACRGAPGAPRDGGAADPTLPEDILHELGVATEIYRAARKAMEAHGPGRLEVVKVAVGELSAVEPELLKFGWEALTSGTPDAASQLDVEWHPARQTCAQCGEIPDRIAGSWIPICPRCGAPLKVEGGTELDLLQVTFTLNGEDPHS